nr:WD40 repeat domain-containing protein [Brasilonema bromeliae]
MNNHNKFLLLIQNAKLSGRRKEFQSQITSAKNFVILMSVAGAVAITSLIQIPSASPVEFQVTPVAQPSSVANPQLLYTFTEHSGTIQSLAFTPDSRILISGGYDNEGIIRLWDMTTGRRKGIIKRAHKTAVESIVISPDGQTLASCSDDNTINLWNLKSYKFTRSFVEHTSNVLSLAMTPNGKVLVSGALDGIRMWDLLQQRPLATLTRFDNSINTVAISPDGQTLASGDNVGVIKLWDLNSGRLIRTISGAHSNTVTKIVFTPDGRSFISASRDRTIKLWSVTTGQSVRALTGHNNWVNDIAINPNGQTLASAAKDGIKLWNLTTGELITTLYGHSDWVSAIAFSPDGTKLASGGFDTRVNVWLLGL